MVFENIVVAAAVRHGLYDLRGRDGGLDEKGREDILRVAQQLIPFFPREILQDTLFLSGERKRVRETADILGRVLGIAAVVLPILNVDGNRYAPREKVLESIMPLLDGKRAVLIAGQLHMVDWLPGALHPRSNEYAPLDYAEASVITADGVMHRLYNE